MSRTITDARQIALRRFLEQVGNRSHHDGTADAKPAGQTELDNLLDSIDLDLTPPLRLDASNPADLVVSVGSAIVVNTESNRNKTIPHVGSSLPNSFSSGTITFPSTSGGTITVSPGNNNTLTVPSNEFIKVLIYMDANGDLNVTPGTPNATEANATVPTPLAGTLAIGYVTLFNNAGTIDNIAQSEIYQFGSGAGGGSGTGQGIINHLDDESASFEGGTVGGWEVKVNNTLTAEPTPNDLGTPDANVTFTTSDTDPLRENWSGIFTKGTFSRQGHFVEVDFTIDNQDKNRPVYISYDYETGGSYETGDVLPFIWDSTNNALVPLERFADARRVTGRFVATNQLSYKLILHIVSQNSSSWTYKVDNFIVGPADIVDDDNGVINYIYHFSSQFENNSTGDWRVYSNRVAGATPTLDDLDNPSVNFTFASTTTSPLRGNASGLITKDAADRQGHGIRIPFSIDDQDLNKPLYVSFDFAASANYDTDDVLPYIWDDTNNEVITLKRSGSSTRFTGRFFANSGSDYQLALHVATTNAAAYTLKVDNFVVGPSSILDMPVERKDTLGTSSDLTSGSLEAVRHGDIVVLTGSFGHSSSTSPSSAVGYLPEWARPDATQMNLYQHDSTAIRRIEVKTDGQISFVYRDFAGSGSASTGTSTFTISYNVPPLNPSALLTTTELLNQTSKILTTLSSSQSISTSTPTTVQLDQESHNEGSLTLGSNVVTIAEDGFYLVNFGAGIVMDSVDNCRVFGRVIRERATVDSTLLEYRGYKDSSLGNTIIPTVGSKTVQLEAGDELRIEAEQDSGNSRNVTSLASFTFLDVQKIPDLSVYGALNDGTWHTMLEVENGYTQRTVDYTNDNFVPIVASGSNSDGEWVRYADGTQVVHERENVTLTTSTAEGNVFRSNFGHTFTYPLPFTTTYGCTVTLNDGGGANAEVICAKTGASTGTDDILVSIWSAANDTYTVTAAFTATGRWRA